MKYIKQRNNIFNVPLSIRKLHDLFKKSGFNLYLVGGCVRDFINNEKPKDFDLVTNAIPEQITYILEKEGYEFNMVGASFGIVIVKTDDGEYEIATYRKDLNVGRKPEVETGSSVTIEDDVQRRDLLINSCYYDLDTDTVIDKLGGIEDIKNKTIRMVGNPIERIREDKLRILRVGRFLARFDGTVEENTLSAIKNNNSLEEVSSERMWDEIIKTYKTAKNIQKFFDFCYETNLWEKMFPDIIITNNVKSVNNLIVDFSELFKNNNINFSDYLTSKFKIPLEYSTKIEFLVTFIKKFDPTDILLWYKKKIRCAVSNSDIILFLKLNNINDKLDTRFIEYVPTIKSEDVIQELGIELNDKGQPKNSEDGKKLGLTIKEKEAESYRKQIF